MDTLDPNQWNLVQNLIDTLGPFDDATKEVSKHSASVSGMLPMVVMLRRLLERTHEASFGIKTMRKELLTSLNTRFAGLVKVEKAVVATTLDPRFKTSLFDNEVAVNAREWLLVAALNDTKPADDYECKPPVVKRQKLDSPHPAPSRLWDALPDDETSENR
jgi:hypothetical protein